MQAFQFMCALYPLIAWICSLIWWAFGKFEYRYYYDGPKKKKNIDKSNSIRYIEKR